MKNNIFINEIKRNPVQLLIAICTILVMVWTVQEMIIERDLEYRPDLRVSENNISLYWDDTGMLIKTEDDYTRNFQDEENVIYVMQIDVDNIGTGNAKDIKYDRHTF